MATLTCDVNEGAAATSSVTLGFSDLVASIGRAVSTTLLAVSALVGADHALATSTALPSSGPELVSTAAAASTAPTQLRATQVATSAGEASSWALHELVEMVEESALARGGVQYTYRLGEGPFVTVVLLGRTVSVVEAAAATSAATPYAAASVLVQERARATSAVPGLNDLVVSAAGSAASSVVLTRHTEVSLTATAVASTELVLVGDRDALLVSQGVASSTTTSQVVSGLVVESRGAGGSVAPLQAVLNSAWVMNTESGGMTRYTDLPVQSMAVVGGKVLALGEGGLYEFAGDTDAGVPITSSVVTGRLTLGSEALKRLGDMIVSYNANGPMQLKVHVYGGVNQGPYTYAMLPRDASAPRGNRIKVGKGLVSKFWQFEWFGVGTRFDVTEVTVDVAMSTNRRI